MVEIGNELIISQNRAHKLDLSRASVVFKIIKGSFVIKVPTIGPMVKIRPATSLTLVHLIVYNLLIKYVVCSYMVDHIINKI